MGSGIARRILHAGFALTVWNRSPEKMVALVAEGATGAPSVGDAVSQADVVVTSLMDDKSVIGMVQSADFLERLPRGAVHLCVTTISPGCADELHAIHRQHGSHYIAGPVVGRPDAAAEGTLISYLAGAAPAIATVTPVCRAYSREVVPVSDRPAVANALKLCINYTGISIIELMGEAYALAEKWGVNPDVLRDFYQLAFAFPALKMYAGKLRARDFDGPAGFSMKAGFKDVSLMLAAANEVGVPLEIARIIERKMQKAFEAGMENRDWSAISEITRREAGLS